MFGGKTTLALVCVFLTSCTQNTDEDGAQSARDTHSSAIVIDAHSDFLDRTAIDGAHINEDPEGAQTSLSKLEQGGVDAQFFSVFVPPAFAEYGFAKRTDELIDTLQAEVAAHPDRIEIVHDTAGINRLANTGKVAALIGIEGGHSIENDLGRLRHFYGRGVRYMTLTWTNTNDWADSSGDEPRWNGLNDLGLSIVKEMNGLGMMIDISHVSDETFWDVIRATGSPVIASHSDVRGVMDDPRNMSDDMVKAVAENGGVIQVSFYSAYVDSDFAEAFAAAKARAKDRFDALENKYANDPIALDKAAWSLEKSIEFSLPAPTVADVVDHIDHVVKIAGIDHVGLGSDFDGMGAPPSGLEHAGQIPNITAELVRRGYGRADIEKILGGNLLRVFAENEKRAARRAP
ncbi:dipeptidase [Sphingorhabdus sp. Alg239-R122]|uniref:dipeptidase n=1 Tax=Sphingorhabdus sp. Alg239-R122 TaxID=2305989 RepID=UPI0013DB92CF|nr:dipeptidase [Sphingorhabdus sp. Alg239-R122]